MKEGLPMTEQEKRIIEMNQEMQKASLKEMYKQELDQEEINEKVKSGEVVFFDTALLMKEMPLGAFYEMKIPEGFHNLRLEFIKRKYPNENRPQLVYTDGTTKINIAFSETEHEVSPSGFETFVYNVLNTVRRAQPNGKMLTDSIKEVNHIRLGYFDFITPSLEDEIYNLMVIFLHKGQANFLTINCPSDLKYVWKPLALGMMETLQLKEVKR